jgi:hypothetical protein
MAAVIQDQDNKGITHGVRPQTFAIDLGWYLRTGRSVEELLKSRRCPTCQEAIRGKELGITAKQHIKEIARTCSKQPGYLEDRMPIMEVLFRIILGAGNAPMTAPEIHRELSVHLESRTYSRVLPFRWLERLLSGDNPYGIAPVAG